MKAMEDLFREAIRQDLLEEFNRGMKKGLPQQKIDLNIKFLKRKLEEKYGIPFSKANGGEIFTTGVETLSSRMGEKMMAPSGIEDVLRQRGMFGLPPSEDQRRTRKEIDEEDQEFQKRIKDRLLEELEGRDFTREMQDEQDLRDRERQMLEEQERDFIRGLPPERPEPEEPMFSIDSYNFDGREVPAITFKDGEILTFPEIESLFLRYKTAPETNLGPETTRQIKEFLQQTNPTKEQFIKHFFLSRRLAEGGEVHKGVGSLSEIARNMNQGGEASLDAEVESLVPAVIQAESNNDPRAVSRDGAIGLMQILPETAMRPGYGVPNIFDIARSQGFDVPEESEEVAKRLLFSPDLNVDFGVKYLKAMRRNFDTMEDALRAYNTGPGNFNKYLMGGRDLSLLDQEAIDYPIKVAAANQGINPNEPADFARFSNSPEAFSTFMQTASEERPMRVPRPKQRPLLSETLFAAPAQPAPQRQEALKQEIEKTVGDVVNRESLQQKYSPEGIEKMLIGTIGESLLPRLFQRGSP